MEKVATRPLRVKQPRDGDRGHVIRGIGFVSECSCGWRSKRRDAWNDAMQDGRDHAAEHETPRRAA